MLTATESDIRITRWPFNPLVIRRDGTSAVTFKRDRLPGWWGTDVTFITSGNASRYIFRPFRRQRLHEYLHALGWPVITDDDVTPGSVVQSKLRG